MKGFKAPIPNQLTVSEEWMKRARWRQRFITRRGLWWDSEAVCAGVVSFRAIVVK